MSCTWMLHFLIFTWSWRNGLQEMFFLNRINQTYFICRLSGTWYFNGYYVNWSSCHGCCSFINFFWNGLSLTLNNGTSSSYSNNEFEQYYNPLKQDRLDFSKTRQCLKKLWINSKFYKRYKCRKITNCSNQCLI